VKRNEPLDNSRRSRGSIRGSVFLLLGSLCLVLGVIGAFLPLLPTTPFVLLAAICFSRGSERAHKWLLRNRWFGPLLTQWEQDRSIDPATRVKAIGLMWVALSVTGIWFATAWYLRGILFLTGALVTLYLMSLPTRRNP
jgi:uncharacterized membrane protein YbaN (DUF454 family)